jgi:hypothetical protein
VFGVIVIFASRLSHRQSTATAAVNPARRSACGGGDRLKAEWMLVSGTVP